MSSIIHEAVDDGIDDALVIVGPSLSVSVTDEAKLVVDWATKVVSVVAAGEPIETDELVAAVEVEGVVVCLGRVVGVLVAGVAVVVVTFLVLVDGVEVDEDEDEVEGVVVPIGVVATVVYVTGVPNTVKVTVAV